MKHSIIQKKVKYYILILLLITISLLQTCKLIRNRLELGKQIKIIPGRGFDNFRILSTTKKDVISELGANFIDTTYLYPSRELQYKSLGVSFIYQSRDNDTIWNIIFYAPFNGITDMGIILNKSTMKDVDSAYGKLWWMEGWPFTHWSSMYPGIQYQVVNDNYGLKYPFEEEKYIKKTITRIEVFNNDHFYKKN